MAALKTRDFQLIGALPAAESAIDGLLRLKCAELKTAKELLKETTMTLSEIAQSVGFSNQQYFSKVFKTETGITPGQFRNRTDR